VEHCGLVWSAIFPGFVPILHSRTMLVLSTATSFGSGPSGILVVWLGGGGIKSFLPVFPALAVSCLIS